MAHRKSILAGTKHWLGKRGPLEIALGLTAAVLAVDHFTAPKGLSIATKAINKVSSTLGMKGRGHPALGSGTIPPPGAVHAGANNGPGWSRGTMPYGGWALNAPAGPWPYAHAGPGSHHGNWAEPRNFDNSGNYGWE